MLEHGLGGGHEGVGCGDERSHGAPPLLHGSGRSSARLFQAGVAAAQIGGDTAVSDPAFEKLVVFANQRMVVERDGEPSPGPESRFGDGGRSESRRVNVENVRADARNRRLERARKPRRRVERKDRPELPRPPALDVELSRARVRDEQGHLRRRGRNERVHVKLDAAEATSIGRPCAEHEHARRQTGPLFVIIAGVKILLLGPEGQLGYELRPLLGALGDVKCLSRTDVDIADLAAIRRAVSAERPAVIVNATAYNEVDRAESDSARAMAVNRDAVLALGEYAKREGAAFVHYSTDFVFDGTKGTPYVESDRPNPLSAYGRSKLAGEEALLGIDAPAIVMRTAWVYSLRRKSFVSMIHRLAREKEELRIVRDQIGSPTFCRDLARATAVVIERLGSDPASKASEVRGVYHAAGEGGCSRYDLARAVVDLDPKRSEHTVKRIEPTTSDAFPAPARRPANAPLDCGKLAKVFGVRLLPWRIALAEALSTAT